MNAHSSLSNPPRPWLANYAPGVPHELELPKGSLLDIVENSVREFPEAPALEFFGSTTTYAQLGEQIDRAAEGLRALGVTAGDPVALVLPNCPQHIAAFYAVLRLGAIVVEHNPLYTARELRHQFEDHRAKVVIAWDKVVEHIQAFPADVAVDAIVSVDVTRAMPALTRAALRLPVPRLRETRASLTTTVSGTTPWHGLLTSNRISGDVPKPTIDDVAVIQYTSGTTGHPKGATLTHLNLAANAAQARAWVPSVPRGEGCVFYAVLPMFHAYGLTLCLTFAMSMGARLVLFPKFDPDLVLKVMRKRPATVLPAVPPIYERLLTAAKEQGVSLEGVQVSISGAMPLSTALVEPWEKATSGYLNEGYGLSECSPVLMANPVSEARRAGTVGLPLPDTEAKVIDPDDPSIERLLGEPGELVVRGPQVMSGYWKKPEETAAVFVPDPDGGAPWFRTGDIVTIDTGGFVTIVDRIKELIITGGFNVSPSEVEEAVKTHQDIVDAAVVGIPNERNGEEVVAAVVLRPGATFDAEAVRTHVRPLLTPYKVPRRVVEVDELPKSLIGKTLRRVVRDSLL
ncbi:AMP-binding protein [Salinibacterium sp. dk2585]|uniref:long-chain-fatty-acid--CoA ligase n=1 Tax=unclassified Salinibacterium TaxID=2632331 RepID=UPI0011C24BD7|nr:MULTISPECIES: long-chain-fatty-acid--CoA ligase [unclassified Salinibacterium]QEE61521.1 AMP-binding protein [Salinibacterium sp. dk2585]TXK52510.1 AMP-binding protein [Salinibacterium sp. dk5596]